MLHQIPASNHFDPFHFASSSPEKAAPPSYVATRPNPYTVKSQNTLYYTSHRSTAQSFPLDPRLTTVTASTTSALGQQSSIDSLYSSLEAANSSPRCSSKPPQPSSVGKYPKLTMVKPKSRPVQSLTSSVELATAAKRLSCVSTASAAASKRRKNVVEAGKQQTKVATCHTGSPRSRSQSHPRSASRSPILAVSLESAKRSQPAIKQRSKLVLPKITIRPPTPEPQPSFNHLFQKDGSESNVNSAPVHMDGLLSDLGADMSKVEDDIDNILSKYFDIRRSAQAVSIELLRSIASSMSRLYCAVEQPDSQLGQLKLRAISSHLFKHTVTGFIHLLEDVLAPYAAASNLALVSTKLLQDFDKATDWCCRVFDGPTLAQQSLKHGDLFLNVLNAELGLILDRGLARSDMQNKLALPGKGSAFSQCLQTMALDDDDVSARPGGSAWLHRLELRKQYAQAGDKADEFAGMNVVRFVGQLVIHQVISVEVLDKWLDRFLVNTVYLGIPSMWEIECACALLITVGATLDRKPDASDEGVAAMDSAAFSSTDKEGEQAISDARTGDTEGLAILNKAMDRIDHLIIEQQISQQAREWLIELRNLRERGWRNREDDLDSLKDCYSSN
ncbi:uncharacterized protein SPSC_04690 [Sporisorium scitamineum]|uniref:Uncharacterized protein n=1 Tax=Sporisorium scitamineum TaxID=49012 RepID=A0A0F7RVP3_9BASI|nr:hypothetical protein [Sporisorium scitamineum]CDU24857.1 uncharacterized protein SPSC_04690 [Sporisorium scitamineum]